MENMTNFFMNEEFIEMTKKNIDFTMDLFKTNMKQGQDFMKESVNEYFTNLNKNLEYLEKNYEKALTQNDDIVKVYRENVEKIYDTAKRLHEKMNK